MKGFYPSLKQDLYRNTHLSQNHNLTITMEKPIIHPRRNQNLTTTRILFNIPSSPSPNSLNFSSNNLKSTPITPNCFYTKYLNYSIRLLGLIPTSEQIRENYFNLPILS